MDSELKKMFIAVRPAGLGEDRGFEQLLKKLRISAEQREIGVKWSRIENLHVTIAFLGEVSMQRVPELQSGLADLVRGHPAFQLGLRKLGAFPDEFEARVLWLGVTRSRELVSLQKMIRDWLDRLGWPPDRQEFTPHLTLGRIRKARRVTDMLAPVVRFDLGEFPIDRVSLFESRQFGSHLEYRILADFPFDPIPGPQ